MWKFAKMLFSERFGQKIFPDFPGGREKTAVSCFFGPKQQPIEKPRKRPRSPLARASGDGYGLGKGSKRNKTGQKCSGEHDSTAIGGASSKQAMERGQRFPELNWGFAGRDRWAVRGRRTWNRQRLARVAWKTKCISVRIGIRERF